MCATCASPVVVGIQSSFSLSGCRTDIRSVPCLPSLQRYRLDPAPVRCRYPNKHHLKRTRVECFQQLDTGSGYVTTLFPPVVSSVSSCQVETTPLSPQRRQLRPQRRTATSPSGYVLVGTTPAASEVSATLHIAVYKVTETASVVDESWSPELYAYAVIWTDSDRNHRQHWAEFLQSEQLQVETLQQTFLIVHRQGPPPAYARTLLVAGDLVEACSLLENYLIFMKERGHFNYLAYHLHDQSDCHTAVVEWAADSALPGLTVDSTPWTPLPWTAMGLRMPTLVLRSLPDAKVQFLLRGNCWLWRDYFPAGMVRVLG